MTGKRRYGMWQVIGAALVAAGCSAGVGGAPAAPDPHIAAGGRLGEVMRAFDESRSRRLAADIDLHAQWEGAFARLAESARELHVAADRLAASPPRRYKGEDAKTFREQAEALARGAAALENGAARSDADAVAEARRETAAACESCHLRFRPSAPGLAAAPR